MGKPKEPATETAEDFLTPASFIVAAKAAHPAFRYALVVAGILAIVVTFAKFGVSSATLVFGAVAVIGLMVMFLVFAQASKLTRAALDLPARVLVWSFLAITIVISGCLTGSVFFNAPLPFRDWIVHELAKAADNGSVTSITPKPVAPENSAKNLRPSGKPPDKSPPSGPCIALSCPDLATAMNDLRVLHSQEVIENIRPLGVIEFASESHDPAVRDNSRWHRAPAQPGDIYCRQLAWVTEVNGAGNRSCHIEAALYRRKGSTWESLGSVRGEEGCSE
jgi:hypothetical protein